MLNCAKWEQKNKGCFFLLRKNSCWCWERLSVPERFWSPGGQGLFFMVYACSPHSYMGSLCVRVRVSAAVLFHKRSYGFHDRRLSFFFKWAPFMLYSVGNRINQAYEKKRGTQEPCFFSSHSRFFVITQVLKLKSASFCFSMKPCGREAVLIWSVCLTGS